MALIFDSFWRALAYCFYPRVIAMSLLPLALIVAAAGGLGYLYWSPAVAWTLDWLGGAGWLQGFWTWLQGLQMGGMQSALAPVLVVLVAVPVIVVVSMLVVALVMTPALTGLVAQRRFPALERRHGASLAQSVLWSVGATAVALVALVLSVPLWLVPPLVLLIPPLIWGWLTYRVMAFDALATHASTAERKTLFRRHGGRMLAMGIVCGYLGAAPGLVWAAGALFFAAFFPVLLLVAVWIYTLVFAFSSLWFLHFGLSALEALRAGAAPAPGAGTDGRQPLALPDEPADHSPPHRPLS